MLTKGGAKLMDFGLARATGLVRAFEGKSQASQAIRRSPGQVAGAHDGYLSRTWRQPRISRIGSV
jgi:hypothetical protein